MLYYGCIVFLQTEGHQVNALSTYTKISCFFNTDIYFIQNEMDNQNIYG